MGYFGNIFFIICLVDYFVIVIAVEPHSKIKGNVESLLELTPWTWKHLNTSLKVDSPVTVDVSLTSHYRLTGKHLNKFLRVKKLRDYTSILQTIPNTKRRDGVYTIYPDMKTKKLVYCDMTTDGGGWTNEDGGGGNEDIHLLTTRTKNELRVDLKKFSGEKAYAKYSKFSVGSGSKKYKIVVGGYSGNAGDSLSGHNGMKFCTKDQDNDTWGKNCAVEHPGGWWFGACFNNHLNGNMESLLELTPWNWKHLNTSFKVDSPVTMDVSLTSHYRLTGKHLNKFLRLKKQRDCASILKTIPNTTGRNGVYTIYPDMKTKKLVFCDMTTDGGGWTVIQRRMDGSVEFYRSWQTYKAGFGKAQGEYWLGNDDIHLLTTRAKQELRVDLQKSSGDKAYAKYSTFSVGSESQKYKLTVGGYSGTAGNSLKYHNGMKFTTRDQDNDTWKDNCALTVKGGWWFYDCLNCDLNGPYRPSASGTWLCVSWYKFGNETRGMKTASMMIRSKI
ncbi:techylectin-5B-like [Crassostrea angulata]|uniref:techylectin-5B-like n=1 Tax=Magallana angulata TaxID=2784310 RepID=UPI0022B0C0AA|nr:techylectin-5B-like [Crassostrea angulata]